MRNPACSRTMMLLAEKEVQLKEYHAAKKDRVQLMTGLRVELTGEMPSPHLSAMVKARKESTQIAELQTASGAVSDSKGILEAASAFFAGIFGEDRCRLKENWKPIKGKKLEKWDAEELAADWTEEEVKAAFGAMAANKSPGKDGLPKELFEAHWDLLGKGFMAMAKDFAASASLSTDVKEAVTILLHKKGDKDQLNNYRPITLLNFSYKVLARVIADRMKKVMGKVISEEQYGFLPGRRLTDAVGLFADVIDAARNKNKDWFLLLVDFKKAYDLVSRDYTFKILREMGFFGAAGWLGRRQGCPLAPYLFLCAVEPLAQEVWRKKLGLSKADEHLSYIGYADDTTLILEGKEQIIKAEKVLEKFKLTSGLETNVEKSVILPLGDNLHRHSCRPQSFRWAGADEAERLLGIWVTPAGRCQPTWEKAGASVVGKLKTWEKIYLPTKARAAVVNGYSMSVVAFQTQVYPPPPVTWNALSKTFQNFVSGNKATADRVFRLWSKDLLHTSREDGGVGVCDPEMILACLSARRVGLLITEKNVLKKEIMMWAAELPMGIESFFAHDKLLRRWEGRSARWKIACENFMKSPLGELPEIVTREAAEGERIVFNKRILLRGSTPVGGQKDAKPLWEMRLGHLISYDKEGVPTLRGMESLEKELGGKGPARLALKAFEAAPETWRTLLLDGSYREQSNPSTVGSHRRRYIPPGRDFTLLPIFEKGKVVPMRQLKKLWKKGQKASVKQQQWSGRWNGKIDWKRAISVGERLSFLSGQPKCPHSGGEETLEHCLYDCPKIQAVITALKRALQKSAHSLHPPTPLLPLTPPALATANMAAGETSAGSGNQSMQVGVGVGVGVGSTTGGVVETRVRVATVVTVPGVSFPVSFDALRCFSLPRAARKAAGDVQVWWHGLMGGGRGGSGGGTGGGGSYGKGGGAACKQLKFFANPACKGKALDEVLQPQFAALRRFFHVPSAKKIPRWTSVSCKCCACLASLPPCLFAFLPPCLIAFFPPCHPFHTHLIPSM
ncbi:unnamed protein product [Closterium sp. Naga37s-1]|nr:unnamed protein product [Closterium sp. Naga37s-1]